MFKTGFFIPLGIAAGLCSSQTAFGWGHLKVLQMSDQPQFYLVTKVIENRTIRFCVSIQNKHKFLSHSNVVTQTRAALKTWLNALAGIVQNAVEVQEVGCDSVELDLKITDRTGLKSAAQQKFGHLDLTNGLRKYFVLIEICSELQEQEAPSDFLTALGIHRSQFRYSPRTPRRRNWLSSSRSHPIYSGNFVGSERPTLDQYYFVYINLLHELGHGFGLCDTYAPERTKSCDRYFKSQYHGPSVMRNANYYFLTDDDVIGIRTLFLRFTRN